MEGSGKDAVFQKKIHDAYKKTKFSKDVEPKVKVLLSTHSVSYYMTSYTHPVFSINLTSSHFNAHFSF
jgi:hypothetical protein